MPKVVRKKKVRNNSPPYRDPASQKPPHPRNKTTVFFEVGNDYDSRQKMWTLYVDILSGDSSLVEKVSASMKDDDDVTFCFHPRSVTLSDRHKVKRFAFPPSKHAIPSSPTIVRLYGLGEGRRKGKSSYFVNYQVTNTNTRSKMKCFAQRNPIRSRRCAPMPKVDFGIELEMSCSKGTPHQIVVEHILKHAKVPIKNTMDNYAEGKKPFHGWKLVSDASIECNRTNPNCSRFELVSPVLHSGEGARELHKVLKAAKDAGSIVVNKSMGFHVHISVEGLKLEQIKNVCLNFCKYEAIIDTLMPLSRRDQTFCQSNSGSIPLSGNGKKHNAIASCRTLKDLCNLMNPQGRYYKMNMQNLKEKRQPTLEFRQHSSTSNYEKIISWVRFCMAMVHNSASEPRPSALVPGEDAFESLFDEVIQDLVLKDYYKRRQQNLND